MKSSRTAQAGPDHELRSILAEIKAAVSAAAGSDFRLLLYGSYARGEQTPESDVDLMLILPDELMTFRTTNELRNTIYDFSLRTPYLFSVLIVSQSTFHERAGFLVFASVEREGVLI